MSRSRCEAASQDGPGSPSSNVAFAPHHPPAFYAPARLSTSDSPPSNTRKHAHRSNSSSIDSTSTRRDAAQAASSQAGFQAENVDGKDTSRVEIASGKEEEGKAEQHRGLAAAPSAALTQTRSEPAAIYVEWADGDPENPYNWSFGRRVMIICICIGFSAITAVNATAYGTTQSGALVDLNTTTEVYLLGNTAYLSIGIAFTPLLLAPLSEIYGRTPIYMVAVFLNAVMFIPQALAPNVYAIILSRFVQGMAASVGNSMVGGSVSDVFPASSRGIPMAIFALGIFVGQGIGPVAGAYTAEHVGWRITFWWLCAMAFFSFALYAIGLRETRGPVLLSRKAKRLTRETGKLHRCRADDERSSFWTAVKISLCRPAVWLVTEPIVLFFSTWIGFLWGTLFLLLQGTPTVFEAYGWSEAARSSVLSVLGLGGIVGFFAHLHQEKLYNREAAKAAPDKPRPEARLYWSCVGAVLAPAAMFGFAWTGQASVHPAVPIVMLGIFASAIFPIYLAVFLYFADVFEAYASSGLAAQSWLRNVFAGSFPLFAPAMYGNLRPPVASSILGAIAAILGLCPFFLLFFGERVRGMSKVARQIAKEEEERQESMQQQREKMRRWRERQNEKERRKMQKETLAGQRPIVQGATPHTVSETSTAHDVERDAEVKPPACPDKEVQHSLKA
ncbi:MFS general substrate transporter [Ceraceosorus guamensis]|uniref:MFS general substrate transporter n=1 Tax=Ceraceosorus guamensis TaxID=1522189 RepID=A0A316VQ04_9BASI|nr:MFS general substrate transporter [Ceraceosorus guamensis]PWN39364.1 MFS general substrate transporter [Ceraceosorus guamensis]